jgi:uncharacterized phiE125 gp8 family phage protein
METAMKRLIVTPPALSPVALAELKHWLGITTSRDDAALTALLRAAMEMCEAFTGIMPIEAACEEVLPACTSWQALSTRPVQAITSVEGIAADGTRFPLPPRAFDIELHADGTGCVLATAPGLTRRFAVRFTAGLAPNWESLPDALRHGILRFAAHQHREREGSGASPVPPATVTALWRPWRRMRLL